LANKINNFSRDFMFPRYKFLKEGWQDYEPSNKKSLSYFVEQKMADTYQKYEDFDIRKGIRRSVGESICASDWEEIPKHEEQHWKRHKRNILPWVTWPSSSSYSFHYLTPYRNVVINTEDDNRDKIYPDKFRNGLDHYASCSNKAELYEFIVRYARKVYPDTDIKKDVKIMKAFRSLTG
jgi:hypothetical protein